MRRQKTSKAGKNYSRKREMKRESEKNNVNKTKVSIKFRNKILIECEKWTRIGRKDWLFHAGYILRCRWYLR
ncbi:hypothetical protein [Bacillus thuringiensis]|uniref:hypothetical protein n=1 Tax=Bacillus thuringiensis TaxID=1428 RepID=UPI0020D24F7C|nr:hypothetical protein [Bacillus thuringiensis]